MKRKFKYLLNLFYWIIYATVISIILLASNVEQKNVFQSNIIQLVTIAIIVIPSIVSFYSSYFYVFPEYIKKRSITLLLVNLIIVGTVSSFIGLLVMSFLLENQFTFHKDFSIFTGKFILTLLISLLNITSGFILKGFISWYNDLKIKEEIQHKAHMMELSLIESKLDPHFLFNTINNIDVLIARDSNKASIYLKKLSSILRFILYESKGRKIKLEEELNYILKYIELQKIRTSNQKFISVNIEGKNTNSRIYPMTFIPFIENAFKHSTNKKVENAIGISILITEEKIAFKCSNKFKPSSINKNGGIGNSLITKRLQLLYPSRHTLETSKTSDTYSASLTIEL